MYIMILLTSFYNFVGIVCHVFVWVLDYYFCPYLFLGFHATPSVRRRVHTLGVPQKGATKGGGQEDVIPGLHHDWLVRILHLLSYSITIVFVCVARNIASFIIKI